MKKPIILVTLLLVLGQVTPVPADEPIYDIVVYGDSSGAVTAAVAAKRQGRSVILVNPTRFLGGMSASGLGATDFLGRRSTFGGIASEFYDAIATAYGKNFVRSFEPHVGRQAFDKLITDARVPVVFNEKLNRETGVRMDGRRIASITTLSGKIFRGKMFIDATYVGDLMAAAGVSYTVGREPESQYGENLAGVRRGDTSPRKHYTQGNKDHFIKNVDPYITPGDPSSGLLPYVFKIDNLTNGQGDRKIQAYNYRVCLTTDPKLRIPIEKPVSYRAIDHELLLRNFEAGDHRLPALIETLAGSGSKVDWNSMHAVGSDYGGANWEYPEASYERRREIEKAHETYIRGLLWTMSNNPRVPAAIRKQVNTYGLPKDEFTDNGGWPYMIYIREARRMVSDYVMTQHNCEGKRAVRDPVGLGSFGMDSHVVQYYVNETGHVRRDGTIWRVPPKPYGISYRSIVPREGECDNLFVPICLSASHVAHGSIRMEPVFMVLSQNAAIAAGVALDKNVSVQAVEYSLLREQLDADQQIIQFGGTFEPAKSNTLATCAVNLPTIALAERPNVIMLFTDDQGTLDAHCYGSTDLHTPHIDKLAATGVRFTQAYAHTVCCPARAMLLTGRHPQRSGVSFWTQGDMNTAKGLNMALEEVTLAEALKSAGYRTALYGKWHLGAHRDYGPRKQGFDEFFGIRDGFIDNYNHHFLHGVGFFDLYEGTTPVRAAAAEKYFPEMMVHRALRFIDENKDRPFFLYVPFNIPHYPEQALKQFEAKYTDTEDDARRSYGAMVSTTDHYVGKIIDKLETNGLRDNSIIVFMSDNGHSEETGYKISVDNHNSGLPKGHFYGASGGGNTGKWLGQKSSFLEGGIRVPAIISYPAALPAGVVRAQAVTAMDWMPTVLELCNVPLPDVKLDGSSLVPIIKSATAESPYEVLHWQWGNRWAVREGEWKLLGRDGEARSLGNLHELQPEKKNHLKEQPRLVAHLLSLHHEWAKEVQPKHGLETE